MSCEICGKSSCTRSFHSLESQEEFDDVADKVKDRMREYLLRQVNRLEYIESDDEIYVKLSDVVEKIEEYG